MARSPYRGRVPGDRLYCTSHDMWVVIADGEVRIGATDFGIHLAGEIIAFTAKPAGAEIAAGRGLGTVESRKTVLAVHSPLSIRLVEANEHAEEHPDLINADPYGDGWMVRGLPRDLAAERGRLVDAAAYRAHIRAIEPDAVMVDADGG